MITLSVLISSGLKPCIAIKDSKSDGLTIDEKFLLDEVTRALGAISTDYAKRRASEAEKKSKG